MRSSKLTSWLLPALFAPAIPYGGQAAIEGVMMKGKEHAALAMRRRDGRIEVIERQARTRFPVLATTPLVRGVFILIDMFGLGMWALRESSHRYEVDSISAEEEKKRTSQAGHEADAVALATVPLPAVASMTVDTPKQGIGTTIAMVLSIGIAMLIFKVLPAAAATGAFALGEMLGLVSADDVASKGIGVQFAANAIEGIVKLSIFIGYVWSVGKIAEIRRVFEYHGAEHIVINAYEDDANNQDMRFIQSHGVAHPRCGTSFIAILILMSIFLFTLLDWALVSAGAPTVNNLPVWYIRWPLRIVGLLPLAGISYEIIRAAFKYYGNPVLRPLLRFGMLFQVLTVRRPSDDQVEVSLASFNRVRYLSEGIEAPGNPQPASELAGAYVS
jgi:uncharacterized protein YqhQ